MHADHVLQRTGHEKILLFKPQLLALIRLIIGVKDPGDVLGDQLFLDGTVIIARLNFPKSKLRGPQPSISASVTVSFAKAENRRVIGDPID